MRNEKTVLKAGAVKNMKKQKPVVLIYKRTHKGDPDSEGIFGIQDCMGMVRNRAYDAVIGIGGKQVWRGHEGIALKLNWIGINPKKDNGGSECRGPLVTFGKFCLYEEKGPLVEEIAPNLYKYMYQNANRRVVMSFSLPSDVYEDVIKILKLAHKSPPSNGFFAMKQAVKNCR